MPPLRVLLPHPGPPRSGTSASAIAFWKAMSVIESIAWLAVDVAMGFAMFLMLGFGEETSAATTAAAPAAV